MILLLLINIMLVISGMRIGIDIFAKYLYDKSKIDENLYSFVFANPEFILELFKHFINKNE